jgi:hypothetical protein
MSRCYAHQTFKQHIAIVSKREASKCLELRVGGIDFRSDAQQTHQGVRMISL